VLCADHHPPSVILPPVSTVFLPLAYNFPERYFTRMISINHILQLVDQHEHITGETMTELSRRATGEKGYDSKLAPPSGSRGRGPKRIVPECSGHFVGDGD
jgi:hypothetical protein